MYKYLLSAYFFLNFYLAGVFVLEIEVNYRTWLLIGADEFPLYHQSLTKLLVPVLLVPMVIAVMLSWYMWFKTALSKERTLFLIHALLFTAFTIATLTMMVPLHNQLSQAFDVEIIRQLIFRSAIFRLPLQVAMVIISFVLLLRFLKPLRPE
ncbi:MAG: hypothetical protein EA361_02330 [Bacteroidetes bacterium]|nr:MAG: hypothetical protein EA361_02330 [Bacteroidota bacterium]